MRITVFGPTGNVGSRVVAEALSRGHDVTAMTRDPARAGGLPDAVEVRTGDVEKVEDVRASSKGQDLVISATRPAEGSEHELVDTTRTVLEGLRHSGVRLLMVGGAASLLVPGGGDRMVLDDPNYVAPEWRPIALACYDQHMVCRAEEQVDWTYVSPPALLAPGERTGQYRFGGDALLVGADGKSAISMEDFAVALLDEAENPKYRQTRFTVAY